MFVKAIHWLIGHWGGIRFLWGLVLAIRGRLAKRTENDRASVALQGVQNRDPVVWTSAGDLYVGTDAVKRLPIPPRV